MERRRTSSRIIQGKIKEYIQKNIDRGKETGSYRGKNINKVILREKSIYIIKIRNVNDKEGKKRYIS